MILKNKKKGCNNMDKLEKVTVADVSKIVSLDALKSSLEMKYKLIDEQILKLALSSNADDNSERLKLLGQRELIINLLSRI